MREVKGLIGADLSKVRYHDHVMLPDQTKTQPAFLIPAIDERGNIKAELIHYLDQEGEHVTQTVIRGDATGCVVRLQKTDSVSSFYITDNFLDGQSIAIGNRKANVYMSLEHYQDLENITWIFNQHEKMPMQVTLTTDNFEKATEKSLYKLGKPIRDMGASLLMAKGHLDGYYTHVTINEAMVATDKIQSENFIQHLGIQGSVDKKLTFQEKMKRAMRTQPMEENQAKTLRSEKQSVLRYYFVLAKEQRDTIQLYFDVMDQLLLNNNYQNALNVAKQANRVYDSLANEIRQINHHSQRPNRLSVANSLNIISNRVLNNKPLSWPNLDGLLKFVATPRFDQKTQAQLDFIVEKIAKNNCDKDYNQAIQQFVTEKSELIKAWQENKLMLSDSNPLKATDIEKLLQLRGSIGRASFLSVVKIMEQDMTHKGQRYGKSRGRKRGDDDDRSRGGRSY